MDWESRAKQASTKRPLRQLKVLPNMAGVCEKGLKWKSLFWMLTQDHKGEVRKGFLKHPFKYGWGYLKSLFQKKSYRKDGDFFLYGIKSVQDFELLLKDPDKVFVLGFSYCHKPFECPSGRFTDQCINDSKSLVCNQCFIGRMKESIPKNTIPLIIPTVHYVGGKIFEIIEKFPGKEVIFLITACEMTLEMFGDWGNMTGIKGIGVRLDGRICNTMEAFRLSERGVKPGLTVVLDETQKRMLDLLEIRNAS